MDIAVITRHWLANYGSFLQTLATQWAIESLGHRCEIVDYVRRDESVLSLERTLLEGKSTWNKSLLRRVVYLVARQPESVLSTLAFRRELRNHIRLTRRYEGLFDLAKNPPKADVFMTGSDQVWGPVSSGDYDPAYLLSFVPKGVRRIAFAASFGNGKLNPEVEALFKSELPHYDAISVREDSACLRVKSYGLEARQVLDPTLLWDSDHWSEFASSHAMKDYVLIYQIHNDSRVSLCAKEISSMLGLPLVRVSASLHQISRGGHFRYLPKPAEFLGLVRDAAYVVTDSFHGTAFSITFNTPFLEILPLNGTSERNESLLRLTGLESRAVKTPQDIKTVSHDIDFSQANERLALDRTRSMAVLKGMIEGC